MLPKKNWEKLKNQLDKWNHEYYHDDSSTVPDEIYDEVMQQLLALEKKYPELQTEDSPSQKIGGKIASKFIKDKHNTPMMSLDNSRNESELLHFDLTIHKLLNIPVDEKLKYSAELKIDGMSISLHYDANGFFAKAITRGDGEIGEVVTQNVRVIKSIPLWINISQPVEVRGEIFLSKKQLERINSSLLADNSEPFSNPRNAAAGTIRQLDSSVAAERKLDAFFYQIINPESLKLTSQTAVLGQLRKWRFHVEPHSQVFIGISQAASFINSVAKNRTTYDYEIDGVVIKLDDLRKYDLLGSTAKFPRYATAFKFPAPQTVTKLTDILTSVGRTGKITYVACLEKTLLAGSYIERATLHNASYIEDNDIRIGDWVRLIKAGDIIPKVIAPCLEKRSENSKKWIRALQCPRCFSELQKIGNKVDQYCMNVDCPERIEQGLIHYCSKKGMNIVGLSKQTLVKFRKLGLIKQIADLYKLENHRSEILNLTGFEQKSFQNILESIERSKNTSLAKLLFALGILHLGEKNAKIIAQYFQNVTDLFSVTEEDLLKIKSFGPEICFAIVAWFRNAHNQEMVRELQHLGVNAPGANKPLKNHFFSNKRIVITGEFTDFIRSELEAKLEKIGAIVTGSVSKKTDFLIAGAKAGKKLERAEELGIEIITNFRLIDFKLED